MADERKRKGKGGGSRTPRGGAKVSDGGAGLRTAEPSAAKTDPPPSKAAPASKAEAGAKRSAPDSKSASGSSSLAPETKVAAQPARSRRAASSAGKSRGATSAVVERDGIAREVSAQERHAMIAERAYLRAERRGFAGGNPVDDWLEGEKEVDALLAQAGVRMRPS